MPAASYTIVPLGDDALTIQFGNRIDALISGQVRTLQQCIQAGQMPGIIECVPAYSALSIFYDPGRVRAHYPGATSFETLRHYVEQCMAEMSGVQLTAATAPVRIPVCYDPAFAADAVEIARHLHISPQQLIQFHTETEYTVFMLGFLPGFAYLGKLPDALHCARKANPAPVPAGSVAIAGMQTGIYPIDSPGGWHIIGRTPLPVFRPEARHPCLLQAGDRVQFYSISIDEYNNIKSRHT